MKTLMVLEHIEITRQGEIRYFEIKLPRNVSEIIRVGHSVQVITPNAFRFFPGGMQRPPRMPIVTNLLIADLKLRSQEKAGTFYSKNVYLDERNIALLDFTSTRFKTPLEASLGNYLPQLLKINVSGKTTIVRGMLQDRWGTTVNANLNYKVLVYLLVKIK